MANRGDRQAAPALSMRQRGDLIGGQAGDFHHRLAGNAVGQHPLGNAQRLGMLSFTLAFSAPHFLSSFGDGHQSLPVLRNPLRHFLDKPAKAARVASLQQIIKQRF